MITKISDGAARVLKHGGEFTVHSIYKNTVNLWNYSDFISITTTGTPVTPISVVTDMTDFSILNINRGDTAAVSSDKVSLPCCELKISPEVELISTYVEHSGTCSCEKLSHAASIIYSEIKKCPPDGSFFHAIGKQKSEKYPLVTGIDEARSILDRAAESIAGNMFYQASNELCELIGLGIGLTPAGDDFLAGVILALLMSDTTSSARLLDKLTGMILSSLCKTGDISSQYMKCACESRFSEILTELSRAIIKGSDENVVKCTNKEIMIGHSSGCDTLSGFIWIVNQLN